MWLLGFIGVFMLLDASTNLDQRVQPSGVIEAAIGAALLLTALIRYLVAGDD
jgi:hypothetical protein